MVDNSFYWFDYETFGKSPQWDKPAQFAGVRTDQNLKIIGEPLMLFCQPQSDYLPDPEASRITGLKPTELKHTGLIEPDFIAKVVAELGYPGTCSVGYNSIRFDDEFTRHTLYRNFHDPYEYEWKDGNSRWDLLDVVRLTRALRPDGIEWPINDDGKPSNKLEHLSAANNIQHEAAHDALSDVTATIDIAKLIKQSAPKLFRYALEHRDKQSVAEILNVRRQKPCIHVSGMVPSEFGHVSIVLPIARVPNNNNGVIVLDLRTDPAELADLSAAQIAERVFIKDAELSGTTRLHIRTIQINKCPVLVPIQTLRDQDAERLGIDKSTQLARANQWHQLPTERIAKNMVDAVSNRVFTASSDTEGNLYGGGFLSPADKTLCSKIRQAQPHQLSQFANLFDDPRYNELLFRYRGRHFPDTLNEEENIDWQDHRQRRLYADSADWITFSTFDATMDSLDWAPEEQGLVESLREYRDSLYNELK
ncbi:MAG: exodeoxyribonuclease I [Gammaproteobacteria bacterium]|nr:exodeoxyribonuclease I [Gammaproteobacteria bacterium]